MKKYHLFLLLFTAAVVIVSCRKETSNEGGPNTVPGGGTDTTGAGGDTSNTGNTEVGTWKFISLHATVLQTTEYTENLLAVKAVTSSDYTTENNSGTVSFSGSVMTSNAVAFTINTNAKTLIYVNGTLANSLDFPLNTTISPHTTAANYQKIGSDSLYFQSGGLIDIGAGGALPSMPTGYKLQFTGNTMTMTTIYDDVTNDTNQGIPEKVTTHAVLVATLQKQ
jgi:hypothetical protein